MIRETSVLLVAKHALIRAGLRALLNATPGFVVLAEARDLAVAAALVRKHHPDVVLVDGAPDTEVEHLALARLRTQLPDACVLFLSQTEGSDSAVECLPYDADVTDFCSAVDNLRGGDCRACALQAQCPAPTLSAALSRRERQVAVSVASGMSSKQIAGSLGISLRTVNTYRESLARKVGASSPAVLTRFVIESGLELIVA